MNLDQIATKCFILALFIRDDGQRLLLGDGYYDFNQKLQHFQGNTIANDIVEIQGDNGQLLAGQVMRSGAQKFEGYIGDATTNRQIIEQKRSDFMAFFRIKHFYKVIYIFPDGTAIQRQRGYLTDAPTIPEIFQKFPEYSVALNFEDANYYEYAEDEHGDEIYAHIAELALAGGATGGLIWDEIGAVTNGISWSGIQTAQGEYIQVTNELDIPAKLASVEMLGNAEQTTYSGKNLMPLEPYRFGYYYGTAVGTQVEYDITSAASQVSFTPRADGTSTMAVSASWRGTYFMSQALTAGTYYLNLNGATTTSNLGASVYAMDSDHKITRQILNTTASPITNQLQMAITLAEGETYISVGIGVRTTSGTITLGTLMLSAGSTATAYEQYVGGTPAPNPDYPQPISVVTGENVVKIEGKNLFDLQASTRTDAGVVFTKTTDTITAIGTTTRGTYAESLSIYDNFSGVGNFPVYATTTATNSFQLPAGTYTFSANITNTGNTTGGLNIGVGTLGARVSTSTKLEKTAGQSGTASATISVADGQYILLSVWYEGTANTPNVNLSINQVQLEKGNSASQFEPYQGQEFEVNLGKNLFDTDTAVTRFENIGGSQMNDWGTYQDGIVTIVKSNGAHGTCAFAGFKPTLVEGETYTLSATVRLSGTNATNQIRFGMVQNSPNMSVSGKDVWLDVSKTFVATATDVSDSRVDIQAANTGNIVEIKNIQLEKGSQTSYAPYFTPIELAKIGNYQDRIYKDDGKWYIEKQVGKIVLNGTQNVSTTTYTSLYFIYTNQFSGMQYQAGAGLSDYFVYNTNNMSDNTQADNILQDNQMALRGGTSTDRLYIRASQFADATAFKTWFSAHNTTVYYALATPTTTEITNEALIAQLDALGASSLYLGVNNIGTETLNAVPTLKIEYYTEYTLDGAGYEWEPGGNTAKTIVTVAGVDSAWPIWTVQGGAQNPTLTNITTGQTISWQGFVPEGQTLTINMAEMTADLAGANVFEYITGEWIRLAPGNNTLVYNAGNADKPSTLSWNGVLA